MKKHFWLVLLVLIVILIGLGLLRVSSFKIVEQDVIASLQDAQSPVSIRFFQIVSDTISYFAVGIPAVFLFIGLFKKNKEFVRKALLILLSLVFAGLLSATLKRTIREPRPYEVDSRITQLSVGGSNSFPSGHTLEATIAAIGFSTILFRTPLSVVISIVWALLIMFSRIVLGVHNFTDIAAGIVVGCLGLLIVKKLFERYSPATA